nr:E3 ubiquitin-protein ligase RMA1-like [Ipomoea batatas]
MGDNVLDDMIMDLDLNQEPSDLPTESVLGFRSFLNDLESAQSRIEERIRHLEAVTARVWERHRWRRARSSVEANILVGQNVNAEGDEDAAGMSSGSGRGCKRDSSHLVAKALAIDSEVKKVAKDGGTFFDCNICLDMAQEPVLTCCGHLYCWACFYQLPYVDSMVKECPVCKGEVADGHVIPIYCNGNSHCETELVSGVKIPPRPKAHRVESVRQQHLTRGLSHIPVAEALRRIRASIGMGDPPNRPEPIGINANVPATSQELQNADGSHRVRPRVFSRVFSESTASLSSELDNAQRIFEDLAASITDRILQRNSAQGSTAADAMRAEDSFGRNENVARLEHPILDTATEISSPASVASSSRGNEDSDAVVQLGNLIPTTSGERDQPLPRTPSYRRRFSLLRFSDINNEVSRETRRRRLN